MKRRNLHGSRLTPGLRALSGIVATAVCARASTYSLCVHVHFLNIMPGGTPGLQHETESTAHTKLSTTTGMRGRRLVEQCARKTSPRCKVKVGWLTSRAPDLQAELVCPSAARGRQCNCCPVWQSQPTSGHHAPLQPLQLREDERRPRQGRAAAPNGTHAPFHACLGEGAVAVLTICIIR